MAKPILKVLNTYMSLEKEILKRVRDISYTFCSKCKGECCDEVICRESLESPFLSILTQRQGIQYDKINGWLGSRGCRLAYGKPLVCHEYFCEQLLTDHQFQASSIQKVIREFAAIGNRAYGNTHLICVHDLSLISLKKALKMNYQMEKLIEKLDSSLSHHGNIRNFTEKR